MELSEIQLGDVVEVVVISSQPTSSGHQPVGTTGHATIIGLDPQGADKHVLVGWHDDESPFRKGLDNHHLARATYIHNAGSFQYSLWVDVGSILRKVASGGLPPSMIRELPCRQCGRMNDTTVKKCWLCEIDNPTQR